MARTKRTPQIIKAILDRIREGESLRAVCRSEGMPGKDAVLGWLDKDPELAAQYARAVSMRTDAMVEEMLEIADAARGGDSDAVQAAKLRVDTRKWVASKMAPRRYGDRSALEVSGPDGGAVVVTLADMVRGLPSPGPSAVAAPRDKPADPR